MFSSNSPSLKSFNTYQSNGDHLELLKRFSKGDKSALVQLALWYAPKFAPKEINKENTILNQFERVDFICNKVIEYFESCANLYLKEELPEDWIEKITKLIDKAEYLFAHKEDKPNQIYFEEKNIDFLNSLNNRLTIIQERIFFMVIDLIQTQRTWRRDYKWRISPWFDTSSGVSYYLKNDLQQPIHVTILEFGGSYWRDGDSEFRFGAINDYIDKDVNGIGFLWPTLDKPYCYLFYDLLVNAKIGNSIFEVDRVDSTLEVILDASHE